MVINSWTKCLLQIEILASCLDKIYFGNNPTKINVFLSHQPFCGGGIEGTTKYTPFTNLQTINEIFFYCSLQIFGWLIIGHFVTRYKILPTKWSSV